MKTIIALIILMMISACGPISQDSEYYRLTPSEIEMPTNKTDPFILGDEVKTPSACTEGVDC
jgi:hypothetical protein